MTEGGRQTAIRVTNRAPRIAMRPYIKRGRVGVSVHMLPGVVGAAHQRAGLDVAKAERERVAA